MVHGLQYIKSDGLQNVSLGWMIFYSTVGFKCFIIIGSKTSKELETFNCISILEIKLSIMNLYSCIEIATDLKYGKIIRLSAAMAWAILHF